MNIICFFPSFFLAPEMKVTNATTGKFGFQ